MMINLRTDPSGCDNCDDWFHWSCLGISAPPQEDCWFCKACINKQQQIELKFKKKRKAEDTETSGAVSHGTVRQGRSSSMSDKDSVSSKHDKHSDKHVAAPAEPKKSQKKDRNEAGPSVPRKNSRSNQDEELWICPGCSLPDDGSPMIGCDNAPQCDTWLASLRFEDARCS